jgi:hypothetical protein
VKVICKNCGATYGGKASKSIDEIVNSSGERVVMLMVVAPARCVQCHNMRVVE